MASDDSLLDNLLSLGVFFLLTILSFFIAVVLCELYLRYRDSWRATTDRIVVREREAFLLRKCFCCADRAGGMRTGAFAEIARSRKRSLLKLAARDSCAICMEAFGDMPKAPLCEIRRCGHVFCKGCIYPWLRRSDACPLCKREIC